MGLVGVAAWGVCVLRRAKEVSGKAGAQELNRPPPLTSINRAALLADTVYTLEFDPFDMSRRLSE